MSKSTESVLSTEEEELLREHREKRRREAELKRQAEELAALRDTIKRNRETEKDRFDRLHETHNEEMILIVLRELESACSLGRVPEESIVAVFDATFGERVLSEKLLLSLSAFPKLATLIKGTEKAREEREAQHQALLERKRKEAEKAAREQYVRDKQAREDQERGERERKNDPPIDYTK